MDAKRGRPLLILDLDETLVRSTTKVCHVRCTTIPLYTENHRMPQPHKSYDVCFSFNFEGEQAAVYTKKRPYCDRFLLQMSQKFEIGIFTASTSDYAKQVIDWLDASSRVVKYRWYRDSCVARETGFMKNLEHIGCDLRQTILVDDNSQCLVTYPRNVIQCKPFSGGDSDRELKDLERKLASVNTSTSDIRLDKEFCQLTRRTSPPFQELKLSNV